MICKTGTFCVNVRDPAADLAAAGLGGTWARMGGDYGGRRVTVGGGIKRIIPLDLGGGLAASGVLGECRRSGLLPWASCGGLRAAD